MSFLVLDFYSLHSSSETSSFISRNRCAFDPLSFTGDTFWARKPNSKKTESGVDSVFAQLRACCNWNPGLESKMAPRKMKKGPLCY